MTAISVEEFASDVYKYIELATISELLIECNNGKRLSIHKEEEEEFADPLTPEEEIKVRQAEEEISRGECYIMHAHESAEEFFARIDADPVGTKLCNTPEWQNRQYLKNRL